MPLPLLRVNRCPLKTFKMTLFKTLRIILYMKPRMTLYMKHRMILYMKHGMILSMKPRMILYMKPRMILCLKMTYSRENFALYKTGTTLCLCISSFDLRPSIFFGCISEIYCLNFFLKALFSILLKKNFILQKLIFV